MFSNRCAKCHSGRIFEYFFRMNEKCTHCGHRFEREEGFFMGAMIIAYFISTLLALPVLLLCIFKFEMEFPFALALGAGTIAVNLPFIYRYSKLVWIHLEEKIYASFKAKRDQSVKIGK